MSLITIFYSVQTMINFQYYIAYFLSYHIFPNTSHISQHITCFSTHYMFLILI